MIFIGYRTMFCTVLENFVYKGELTKLVQKLQIECLKEVVVQCLWECS
jgi:hypothetical protein